MDTGRRRYDGVGGWLSIYWIATLTLAMTNGVFVSSARGIRNTMDTGRRRYDGVLVDNHVSQSVSSVLSFRGWTTEPR